VAARLGSHEMPDLPESTAASFALLVDAARTAQNALHGSSIDSASRGYGESVHRAMQKKANGIGVGIHRSPEEHRRLDAIHWAMRLPPLPYASRISDPVFNTSKGSSLESLNIEPRASPAEEVDDDAVWLALDHAGVAIADNLTKSPTAIARWNHGNRERELHHSRQQSHIGWADPSILTTRALHLSG